MRLVSSARKAATGSRMNSVLPPNDPPMGALMTRTRWYSSPRSSALFTTATPSQPPRNALRSIMGASVGCIRRAPKLTTGWSPAAFLHRAALVATPEAWQSNPKSAVSYWAKST